MIDFLEDRSPRLANPEPLGDHVAAAGRLHTIRADIAAMRRASPHNTDAVMAAAIALSAEPLLQRIAELDRRVRDLEEKR